MANPNARPEKVDTIEVDVERRIGKRLNLVTAAYGYRLRDFLVSVYTAQRAGPDAKHGKNSRQGLRG